MAAIGGWDRQHGYDNAAPPDEWPAFVATMYEAWKSDIEAWEDGLTEVEPPRWKEFWG